LPPGVPGVIGPEVLYTKRPEYTAGALQVKLQGAVLLEAVVRADGSVGAVRVVRSLDDRFGLDQKAIDAVRQWRFRPATLAGTPVSMAVLVELTFRLH
jgi:protein TonB